VVDFGTLVVALIGAVGGAAAAGVGNFFRTRSTIRTAARLVYAELTRNSAAVAYYCSTHSWPAVAVSRSAWDSNSVALAQMRDVDIFDAVYQGYSALEAIAYIAGDTSGTTRQDSLLEHQLEYLRKALRIVAAQAQISPPQVQAEVARLRLVSGDSTLTPMLAGAPPSLLYQLVDIQLATGNAPTAALEAAARTPMRAAISTAPEAGLMRPEPRPGTMVRRVYDAQTTEETSPEALRLARGEGDPPTGDPAVDEVYDTMGMTHHFYWEEFGLDLCDGTKRPLEAVVHFGKSFDNTTWNGQRLLVGDGDGKLFNRFSIAPEVIANQLSRAMTWTAGLPYSAQTGAVIESVFGVFGVLVKQWTLGQTADQADWLIGAGLVVQAPALYSLKAPGTAYDNALLGKDRQPAHMSAYIKTEADQGGVHINSGIPNHAFYLLATRLGGHAWERAGRIWYKAVTSPAVSPSTMRFAGFAGLTVAVARRDYGQDSEEARATRGAWRGVGVAPRLSKQAAALVEDDVSADSTHS
jgi:hypothetical protein